MKNLQLLSKALIFLVLIASEIAIGNSEENALCNSYLVPIQWYGNIAYDAFDQCSQEQPLARFIFGNQDFTIGDIFLLSKLSSQNLMRNANIDALEPVRPAGSIQPFGNYQSDQYIATLAQVKVNIEAEQRQQNINLGASYRRAINDAESAFLSIGFNIPIVSKLHLMDLYFTHGNLSFQNRPLGTNIAQTILAEFFKDYIDMRDFFERAILEPKKLTFLERQRKVGVGDISLYAALEKTELGCYLDDAQLALNLVLPSGNKQCGNKVWEIELGNGGAVQVEGSLALYFNTPSPLFNPVFRLVAQASAPFDAMRRVPAKREQVQSPRVLIANFDDLLAPIATFRGNYYVDPFQEYDASVLYFSDLSVKTRIHYGARALIGIGNYFYNLFKRDFRLGVFYDFMHKSRDHVCVLDPSHVFDNELLEKNTNQRFHRFGWSLSHICCDPDVEFTIGSQHIIAGKNIARIQEAFVSMSIAF